MESLPSGSVAGAGDVRARAPLSPATAMRALATVVAIALWSYCSHGHAQALPRALFTTLGITDQSPVHRFLACSQTLGITKCFSTLSLYRAENALENIENGREINSNLTSDVKSFHWEQYRGDSDEQLYSQLCDGVERLLRHRSLALTMIPGYKLQLSSKGNGTLSVDVLKGDDSTGRSTMKKLRKEFYNILPIMILPGLVMSAILPFVLPALKMLTVATVMMNNMALSGAVFTLLRNNAFNDHYEKKVIYVNEGYKNEKLYSPPPLYFKHLDLPIESGDYHFASSNVQGVVADPASYPGGMNDFLMQGYPTNDFWIDNYYGNESNSAASAGGGGMVKVTPIPSSQRRNQRFKSSNIGI